MESSIRTGRSTRCTTHQSLFCQSSCIAGPARNIPSRIECKIRSSLGGHKREGGSSPCNLAGCNAASGDSPGGQAGRCNTADQVASATRHASSDGKPAAVSAAARTAARARFFAHTSRLPRRSQGCGLPERPFARPCRFTHPASAGPLRASASESGTAYRSDSLPEMRECEPARVHPLLELQDAHAFAADTNPRLRESAGLWGSVPPLPRSFPTRLAVLSPLRHVPG